MRYSFIFIITLITNFMFSQSIVGVWQNYEDDIVQSHIEIFESQGRYHARVIKLFPHSKVKHCKKCGGDWKNKELTEILIIKDLVENGEYWSNGKILDPKKGKFYSCQVNLDDHNTLKVRGFVGKPLFGKSFYWHRVH